MSRKNAAPAFLFYLCGFMTLVNNIQIFLIGKLKEYNLKRKDFAKKIGISYTAVNQLINAQRLNPDIATILKIAKCCNCTIDKVIGRKIKKDSNKVRNNAPAESEKYKFNDISLEEALLNLKNFINKKLKEENLKPKELSRKIGFSESPIVEFINNTTKSLSTEVILALANYFKVSIDEMIGRIPPSNQEPQTLEKDKITN